MKFTPSNCKYDTCLYNPVPPSENNQECIGCDGNKDPDWKPDREERRKYEPDPRD